MDFIFLSKTVLFLGIQPAEIEGMMDALGTRRKTYQKGQYIYHAGEMIRSMGIVLSGGVNIENNNLWGSKDILNHISPGQIFAETYACIPDEPMMVSAVADAPSEILFLEAEKLVDSRVVRNLLAATAQKNLNLSRRIMHTSAKTIRGRLLSYLSFQAARQGDCEVTIPFNRQQLADYLSVDRSALSNELGKMRREGLLEFHKNHFILYDKMTGSALQTDKISENEKNMR